MEELESVCTKESSRASLQASETYIHIKEEMVKIWRFHISPELLNKTLDAHHTATL
jgi:hypothetical protein